MELRTDQVFLCRVTGLKSTDQQQRPKSFLQHELSSRYGRRPGIQPRPPLRQVIILALNR